MNKQEIENKLEEMMLLDDHLDYDSLIQLGKNVFNFALELAAENAYISNNHQHGTAWDSEDFEIDKQSILDLKL